MTQSLQKYAANEVTGEIVDSCIKIHKALGPGLLEKIYEECLCHELSNRGIYCERQKILPIRYENLLIDNAFKLDLLVEDTVIVELKSIDQLHPVHEAQILTYMKLTGKNLGLLINFNVPLLKDGLKRFKF